MSRVESEKDSSLVWLPAVIVPSCWTAVAYGNTEVAVLACPAVLQVRARITQSVDVTTMDGVFFQRIAKAGYPAMKAGFMATLYL
jgi:hypothetical protein